MTLAFIANHLWQSTIVAGAAWLLTLAFRRHRAQIRYGLWLAASMKFLVPFGLLVYAGGQLGWRQGDLPAPPPAALIAGAISQPFSTEVPLVEQMAPAAMRPAASTGALTAILAGIWLAGFATLLIVWSMRWRRVAAIVRRGQPAAGGVVLDALRRIEIRSGMRRSVPLVVSDSPLEPGVFGILNPVLLWPRHIERHLTGHQIDAVLAHEVAHARRRDNLAAAAHMAVQAAFWFHPVVWMIGSRLVEERERSCDEDVVGMGSDPRTYAESILKTCQWCLEAPAVCVAGVTGSNLKWRVEQIMGSDRRRPLTAWSRLVLALTAMVSLAVPIAVGAFTAPPLTAQIPAQAPPAAGAPSFEVASIKTNTSGDGRVLMRPQPGGRLSLVNVPLRLMIGFAYRVQDFQIVAGPDWLGTTRFDVVAKAEAGNPSQDELRLMLRSLLADRFKLVVRPSTREMPTYSLVPARGDGKPGVQLRKSDANCSGPASAPSAPPAPGQIPPCESMVGFGNLKARGTTLPALAAGLSIFAGRIVVDRTGLAGAYDVDLNWTPDQIPRPAGGGDQPVQVNGAAIDPNGPSLFTALQEQLGLKLESSKGPVDVLVVERAEKPTED